MRPGLAEALIFCTGVLVLSTCSERIIVNNSDIKSAHVMGAVYGWMCQVGDLDNDNLVDTTLRRYSVWAGELALITFIRDDGYTSWFYTDSMSNIDRYVGPGTYKAIVETGYTIPDTFSNLHFRPGDTTIAFHIVYDVNDPLHLALGFQYASPDDTLGLQQEWTHIVWLNEGASPAGMPYMLMVDNTIPDTLYREVFVMSGGFTYVTYIVSIRRQHVDYGDLYNVFEVSRILIDYIATDSAYQDLVFTYPSGAYLCTD
ncbi:MAG: hypothetical protein JSU65_07025 [Candidatus Zixiibacteriota bacterium]|nr:MAG: hypothetical protein JSU65_07025 [candidate division Zixibacteria bacterium]